MCSPFLSLASGLPRRHARAIAILQRRTVLISVGVLLAARSFVFASDASETSPGYPVRLGDDVIFHIRAPIQSFSAEERARIISQRISAIADNPAVALESFSVTDFELPLTVLNADDKMVLFVSDEDARIAGRPRQELLREYTASLRTAIAKYREARSLRILLVAVLAAVLATIVLVVLLLLLRRLNRRVNARLQAWFDSQKSKLRIQSFELIRAERLRTLIVGLLAVLRWAAYLVLIYIYLQVGLGFFPWTQALARRLLSNVMAPLTTVGQAIWSAIPDLLMLAVIGVITVYALKLIRLFFKEVELGVLSFKNFHAEWAQPTYKICRILIVAFALVVAFPFIPGSSSPAFKGVSLFFGVLFSLGSTSAISNILAGYTLIYRRVYHIGDRVKIGDVVGDVAEVRLQITHLRTIKNEEITVPNSLVVNSAVVNYSALAREKGLILHTTVTIGYDAPWRQVHALLLLAAERTPGLLREPPAFVRQTSLDDFYVRYELNVYTDAPLEMGELYSELHKHIQDAFNEHGVQIMSPHYEADPAGLKLVPQDRWFSAPASANAVSESKTIVHKEQGGRVV